MNTVTPEEVGFSASRLSRIGTWMQGYIDQNKLAGTIAMVARCGKVAYLERFGMMDLEAAKPMQFDTIFRIYSMTKPIASVALMMLYEEGQFQLNDPVSKFIPEFADVKVFAGAAEEGFEVAELEREITIWHLLTHTAGLTYDFFEDSPVDAMYLEADLHQPDRTAEEVVHEIVKLPLVHQPGTAWRYSMATDVLGYLVEVISGMSLAVFFEEKVLKPLGMEDTDFYVPEAKLDRFAAEYGPSTGPSTEFTPSEAEGLRTGSGQAPTENGGIELLDAPATSPYSKPTRFLSGGVGLVSTASDYMRFAQMLLNGGELDGTRLLGRKTVELMTINHLPDELIPIQVQPHTLHGCSFGLGFRVLVNLAQAGRLGSEGEFGWGGAASTSFFVDPKEKLIGLLLTQLVPSRYYPIRNEFKVLVYQALVD
ncbi:MAG: class A beta-lactamase-related serine hydrolase [Anaerolineales bacterium]|nr:MAG: class A beta-lactamase-related serine hydrolase [Anaerolineales bacterium]